jgi:hypothetical protein
MKNINFFFTIIFLIVSIVSISQAKASNFSISVNQKEYENIMFFLAGETAVNYKMNISFDKIKKIYILKINGNIKLIEELKKNLKRYKTIVKKIPQPKYLNTMNNTLDEKKLKHYIMTENIKRIREIIPKLNHINFSYDSSYTPLYYAISTDNIKIVELLIQQGLHVNYNNSNEKLTPLHHASKFGNIEIVRLLLEHGAIVNRKDIKGRTALHYASDMGYKDIIYLLLSKGAKKDIIDQYGLTPRF